MLGLPVVRSHAAGMLICFCPHACAHPGSLGDSAAAVLAQASAAAAANAKKRLPRLLTASESNVSRRRRPGPHRFNRKYLPLGTGVAEITRSRLKTGLKPCRTLAPRLGGPWPTASAPRSPRKGEERREARGRNGEVVQKSSHPFLFTHQTKQGELDGSWESSNEVQ